MKIGILTFQETTNYGALLQATALQKALEKINIESEIIDYECSMIAEREIPRRFKGISFKRLPFELLTRHYEISKFRKMKQFQEKYSFLSDKRYTRDSISEANDIYDKFLAGSDMIWNLEITGGDSSYYLDFVNDSNKKYAFSSSFGYDEVPEQFIERTCELLKDFAGITVREEQGAEIIKKLTGRSVSVTADPTLLLSGAEWEKYEEPFCAKRPYVLVYFNDRTGKTLQFARQLAKEKGWNVYYITNSLKPIRGVRKLRDLSVGQFLWMIHHAQTVVTASFHGVVFSMNYHVPFYYVNRNHFGRIETIVRKCEIKNRNLLSDELDASDIDWELVDKHIEEYRDDSMRLLKDMLSLSNNDKNILSVKKEACCGCTACKAVCPVDAITMEKDEEGFAYPFVDKSLCVNCGKCLLACNKKVDECKDVIASYAARNKNDEILKKSSSGGVSHALCAEIVKMGGIVYGATWDENHVPVVKSADSIETCDKFYGSKYVQTDPQDTFRSVRNDLLSHKPVLYFGTSCMIAGLLSYLHTNGCDTSRLYTVDLVCHGVPSPMLFADYIAYLKKNVRGFDRFEFRTKEKPWGYGNRSYGCTIFSKDGVKETDSIRSRIFLMLFFSNRCLRPYCHSCEYANVRKPSDLTMGDYWGLVDSDPEFFDERGVSAVLVHTEKGKKLLESAEELLLKESNIEDITRKQLNLRVPSPVGADREAFWRLYKRKGFSGIARVYGENNWKCKVKKSKLYKTIVKFGG